MAGSLIDMSDISEHPDLYPQMQSAFCATALGLRHILDRGAIWAKLRRWRRGAQDSAGSVGDGYSVEETTTADGLPPADSMAILRPKKRPYGEAQALTCERFKDYANRLPALVRVMAPCVLLIPDAWVQVGVENVYH